MCVAQSAGMLEKTERAPVDRICLDSSRRSQTLVINTSTSVYEVIVLRGEVGDVMVRGGSRFPEFRRARFIGSTVGSNPPLQVHTIDVGMRMHFDVGDRIIVTSRVTALSPS